MARRLLSIIPSLPLVGAIALACGEPSHVFEGRRFAPDRGCLGATEGLDVVTGDRPGACAPACLAQPLGDGGRAIYVATMCPPYPFAFDASGSDPRCLEVLAALERGDTCLADGGSTHPGRVDGGAEDAAPR